MDARNESENATYQLILGKLNDVVEEQKSMETTLNKRFCKLDEAITSFLLLRKDFDGHEAQLKALWKSHHNIFGIDGSFAAVQQQQAMCPKDVLKEAIKIVAVSSKDDVRSLSDKTDKEIDIISKENKKGLKKADESMKFHVSLLYGAISVVVVIFGIIASIFKPTS